MKALLRGKALVPGATIGIVAPASGFDESRLRDGIAKLVSLGYRVKIGEHVHDRSPQYFAGTPQQRADDLHAMFADAEVGAVLCARGGYGSQAILPLLDLDVIRNNPKPIMGCSDLTALQLWLLDQCGLVCLHGPMAAGDFSREDGVDLASWNACTQGTEQWSLGETSGLRTLCEGAAKGRLWGGCLSLLVSTLATPFELLADKQDTILFVEDVSEKPYKIERMLTQWRDAGKLQSVTGIVFGEMLGCEQPDVRYTLVDVLRRALKDFAGPVAYGLRSGHVSRANVTLPLGVRVELHCGVEATLTMQEAATILL